jgi:hypothetical protein
MLRFGMPVNPSFSFWLIPFPHQVSQAAWRRLQRRTMVGPSHPLARRQCAQPRRCPADGRPVRPGSGNGTFASVRSRTSNDGIGIRTGQTSPQAPYRLDAVARSAVASNPSKCGEMIFPIGPGPGPGIHRRAQHIGTRRAKGGLHALDQHGGRHRPATQIFTVLVDAMVQCIARVRAGLRSGRRGGAQAAQYLFSGGHAAHCASPAGAGSRLARRHRKLADQLLQQHRAICDAICAHRPEEARAAMQSHIDFVSSHAIGSGG